MHTHVHMKIYARKLQKSATAAEKLLRNVRATKVREAGGQRYSTSFLRAPHKNQPEATQIGNGFW